jgi:hypothetical protein
MNSIHDDVVGGGAHFVSVVVDIMQFRRCLLLHFHTTPDIQV